MSEYTKIASKTEIENGAMKTFSVGGKKIVIANIDGEYFAIDDVCSHAECSLGEGFLDDKTVICPCHGSTFDVTNGKVLSLPATRDVASYPVKLDGDDILIQI